MGGGGLVGGGWTKTKLMLFSTQVEVVVELKLKLSLAIHISEIRKQNFKMAISNKVLSSISLATVSTDLSAETTHHGSLQCAMVNCLHRHPRVHIHPIPIPMLDVIPIQTFPPILEISKMTITDIYTDKDIPLRISTDPDSDGFY